MDTTRIDVANGCDFATKPALSMGIAKVHRGMKYEAALVASSLIAASNSSTDISSGLFDLVEV